MRLHRIVHQDSANNPLPAYSSTGRYHQTSKEAQLTSYLSFDLGTCAKEVAHHLGNTVRLRNRVAIEFEVEPERVVDLTKKRELTKLGLDPEDLIDEDWTVTQNTARTLRRKGVQALIVPSARDPHGLNAVLFLENLEPKVIRRIREQRLD